MFYPINIFPNDYPSNLGVLKYQDKQKKIKKLLKKTLIWIEVQKTEKTQRDSNSDLLSQKSA